MKAKENSYVVGSQCQSSVMNLNANNRIAREPHYASSLLYCLSAILLKWTI